MIRQSGSRFSEIRQHRQQFRGTALNLRKTTKKPGPRAVRAFLLMVSSDQAAGLNSLLALFLIGSTVSVATRCDSSESSLPQAE
jgi:hypothetical protein